MIRCALTGERRAATPEEYVRQWVLRYLMHIGYRPEQMVAEYKVKIGSDTRRIDVAVFTLGSAMRQEDLLMAVECKRQGVSAAAWVGARQQCESYLAASPNALIGVVTDGARVQAFRKGYTRDGNRRSAWTFIDLTEVPGPMQMPDGATMRAVPMRAPTPTPLAPPRTPDVNLGAIFLVLAVVCGGAALLVFVGLIFIVAR